MNSMRCYKPLDERCNSSNEGAHMGADVEFEGLLAE